MNHSGYIRIGRDRAQKVLSTRRFSTDAIRFSRAKLTHRAAILSRLLTSCSHSRGRQPASSLESTEADRVNAPRKSAVCSTFCPYGSSPFWAYFSPKIEIYRKKTSRYRQKRAFVHIPYTTIKGANSECDRRSLKRVNLEEGDRDPRVPRRIKRADNECDRNPRGFQPHPPPGA